MRHIAIIAFAACTALAGCSKEEPVAPQSGDPIRLIAAVNDRPDGFTRVTTENTWNGGEEIALEIRGQVKKYVADANGTLTPAPSVTPFYWPDSHSQVEVRAWRMGTYLSAEPKLITVQADQSGAGYGASDFLFAAGTVTPSNPALAFAHKTVKVVLNVRADGRTVESLKLGDLNLAMSGAWNKTAERIDPAQGGSGTVTAFEEKTAAGFDASYAALLIPQEMGGKTFIRVTVDGQEYAYTPKQGELALEGGKRYTFKVTVRNEITVESVSTGEWGDGGSEDVVVRTAFTADMLKAGDYLYADGSWSDGGLRATYSDGRVEWAETKPAPEGGGKTVIGIVFQTDPSRISAAEKELFASKGKTLHGLAMSVKTAGNNEAYRWFFDGSEHYNRDESVEDPAFPGYILPNLYSSGYKECFSLTDADINGYFNTQVIKIRRAGDLAAGYYPAFRAAVDFAATAGGPEPGVFTSGWYLPSTGQWIDFLRNIVGAGMKEDNLKQLSGGFAWENIGDISGRLNAAISAVPEGGRTAYESEFDGFRTSTAGSHVDAFTVSYINRFGGQISLGAPPKSFAGHIRCAIAF